MALSELAALDAAYQVLRPLDAAGSRRALQWLSDALATEAVLASELDPTPNDGTNDPSLDGSSDQPRGGASSPSRAGASSQPRGRASSQPGGDGSSGQPARQPRRRAAASSSTVAGAPRQPRRRAAAASSAAGTPGKRTARASRTTELSKRAEATTRRGSRPYRRMPPAEEVMAAYRQVGSVSAMAGHFGVPGHTVQGWARQLRRHGYAIGQSR